MKKTFFILITNCILAITFANKVLAQDVFGTNDLAEGGIALGTKSIQDTIGGIVNIFLGFLGILATLLILYAGFLWMTSRGNAEKIARAKLLIASAVIGLVIIVSAYAISRFLLSRLYDVAGPGGGGGGGPGPDDPGLPTCVQPADDDEALICSLSETIGPVGSGVTIRGWHFDTDGDRDPGLGGVTIGGFDAEIVECAGSQMWRNGKVKVKVPEELVAPGDYDVILHNDIGNESVELPKFVFSVIPGDSLVNIDCLVPDEEAAPNLPINVQILGDGFTDIWDNVSMNAWLGAAEVPTDLTIIDWSDLEINVTVPANALASDIIVTVGVNSDQEFFNVSCADDDLECSSGCCSSNSCVSLDICTDADIDPGANAPVIQDISPDTGEEDTLVTIYGYNFGNDLGVVTFDNIPGTLPATLNVDCINAWTDSYIIIGVPDIVYDVVDVVVIQAATAGGESSDPYPGFERTNQLRPGICNLDPLEGSFGDSVAVTGVNFANNDTAYFDTIASYQTNLVGVDITTQVPNVVGSLGVTIKTADLIPIVSNPFPFLALSISGGNPVITELSPDNGPVESYITIMGSNFGDNVGWVYFDVDNISDNFNEELGEFDFPPQCGDYWFDDHIIVKVPGLGLGIHPIRVGRASDGVLSNDYDFEVTNTPPGPQICAIIPDNGPIGEPVDIFGENLGPNDGTVIFYDSINVNNYTVWNSFQVLHTPLPVGAATGLVVVEDEDGNVSNALPFNVGACTANIQCGGQTCCPEGYCADSCEGLLNEALYSWEVNTEAEPFELYYSYSCASGLQSPTPWPHGHMGIGADGFDAPQPSEDAFLGSNISALFTRDVNDDDFVAANIILHQCGVDCTTYVGAPVQGTIAIINQNTDREGFSFDPSANLLPGTWYEVELGTFQAEIGSDEWTPGVADEWTFRTRDDNLLCEVTNVVVTPQTGSRANVYPGRDKNFNASPIADNCNICGGDYDWTWSMSHSSGAPEDYASIFPLDNVNVNKGFTRLTGIDATERLAPPANFISLEARNIDDNITGESQPMILAPVLRVEDHGPDCDDSCGNALVWVEFNTDLQALTPNQFNLHLCDTVFCNNYGPDLNDSIDTSIERRVTLNGFAQPLTANATYIVIVDPSVVNIYGYPLETEYSWTFTVGEENCEMTGAKIYPPNEIVYSSRDVRYRGEAIAEGGSCGAQAIDCVGCNWNWSTNPVVSAIATITSGASLVDATPLSNGTVAIDLTIAGGALGTESASTDLTVLVDGLGDGNLRIDRFGPDCLTNCNNAEVYVVFDLALDLATVNVDNFKIFDVATNNDITTNVTPIGPTIVISHADFDVGEEYRVEISTDVTSTAATGSLTLAEPFEWTFAVTQEDCLADSARVIPANAVAGTDQDVSYTAMTFYEAASCPQAVTCDTCAYSWQDNALGDFGGTNNLKDSTFRTDADVVPDQETDIILNVTDGVNTLDVTNGHLRIAFRPFEVDTWWPACAAEAAACVNSEIGVRFTNRVNPTSLTAGRYTLTDITGVPIVLPVDHSLTGGGKTLKIGHSPLALDHIYRVNIGSDIEDTYGTTLGADFEWDFTVGLEECRIDSTQIDPAAMVAGKNQNISYNVQTAITTVPGCGYMPIYCEDCIYEWTSASNPANANGLAPIGIFNDAARQSPIFRTANPPSIANLDRAGMSVIVIDQELSITSIGTLNIDIPGPGAQEVELVGYFPPDQFNFCTNMVPYFEFDITNGNLDRNSLIDHAVFYEWNSTVGNSRPIDFTIKFVEFDPAADPRILTAIYEPDDFLAGNDIYFFGLNDIGEVRTEAGNPITIHPSITPPVPGALVSPDAGLSGVLFAVLNNACALHSVEITPQTDLFTCIGNTCLSEDVDPGTAGNQHQYTSVAYDIQRNLLIPGPISYDWGFGDPTIVNNGGNGAADFIGTADNNGTTHLGLIATMDGDTASDSATVQVSTCQAPWPPPPDTFPWHDNEGMNFSTYYCMAYDDSGEDSLDPMPLPTTVPISGDVIKEFISIIDNTVALNGTNSYLGSLAYNDQPSEPWFKKLSSLLGINKTQGAEDSPIDIIGFRVMLNSGHMSVLDWYGQNAPNPEQAGALIQVDGYEALRVGSTTYIAATNVVQATNSIYTNIYIIAHNIEATSDTVKIYNQLIDNFKLNTNLTLNIDNTCVADPTTSCTSDFDCGTPDNPDTCNSQKLKLRRDTKRISDLIGINNTVTAYGNNHKACANNSLVSCNSSADCIDGACVPYYPPLNSGSYLNGLSNSRWPSWQITLSNTLNMELPEDPINRFNGCEIEAVDPGSYNSDTCWNEATLDFLCPTNSLVYLYDIEGVGANYDLWTNLEYDEFNPEFALSLSGNLSPAVTGDIHLNMDNDYCTNIISGAPGASANPYCGNGIIDENYCSNLLYITEITCAGAGETWIDIEECDNQFHHFACSQEPPVEVSLLPLNPPFPTVGVQAWWNERTVGCHPPGSDNECTWYRPDPELTALQCGGYCGDGITQPYYEDCDDANDNDGDECSNTCNDTAVYCGNGVHEPDNNEQCDDGNDNDDDECSNDCQTGNLCGNGIEDVFPDVDPSEECDWFDYVEPTPALSSATNTYECSNICTDSGGYCGDSIVQGDYEGCDKGLASPTPAESSANRQYTCTNDCTNTDGWCGDLITNGPEQCDGEADCEVNCQWEIVVGECGNGQMEGTEECDDGNDVDTDNCSNNCIDLTGSCTSNGQSCESNLECCSAYCDNIDPANIVCGNRCGNGICDWNETFATCQIDCPAECNLNGICEPALGEGEDCDDCADSTQIFLVGGLFRGVNGDRYGDIFKTTNGGISWTNVVHIPGPWVESLGRASNGDLFAGVETVYTLKSENPDGGDAGTWSPTGRHSSTSFGDGEALMLFNGKMYVGVINGLYEYDDINDIWIKKNDVLQIDGLTNDGTNIYLGTATHESSSTYGRVFKCSTDGVNCTQMLEIDHYIRPIFWFNSKLYAGTWQGGGMIYESADQGVTWDEVLVNPGGGITAFTEKDGEVYAGGAFGKIFKRTDVNTWDEIGITEAFKNNLSLISDGGKLFAGMSGPAGTTGASVYRSDNNGISWTMLRKLENEDGYMQHIFAVLGFNPPVHTCFAPVMNVANLPTVSSTEGVDFAHTTLLSQGTAPMTWSITSGSLPVDLNLDNAGTISGIPVVGSVGTYNVVMEVDTGCGIATFALEIIIDAICVPPVIDPDNPPNAPTASGTENDNTFAYNTTLTQGSFPIWSIDLTGGGVLLPTGLNLDGGGIITGMPAATTAGIYNVDIKAENACAASIFDLAITICEEFNITNPIVLSGTEDTFLTYNTITQGTANACSLASGAFPVDLAISADGTISGIPDPGTAGVYTGGIECTNVCNQQVSAVFDITIDSVACIPDGSPLECGTWNDCCQSGPNRNWCYNSPYDGFAYKVCARGSCSYTGDWCFGANQWVCNNNLDGCSWSTPLSICLAFNCSGYTVGSCDTRQYCRWNFN